MTWSQETFSCPGCGQQFDWQPEFAGRKLACSCGHVLVVPPSPLPPTPTYDLRPEEPPPGQLALDAAGNEIKPVPVLSYQRGALRAKPGPDELAAVVRRDFWVPLGIIAASALMLFALALAMCLSSPSPARVIYTLSLRIAWDVGITFLAGVLLTTLLDISLGPAHVAALKLAAVAVGRLTLWAMVGLPIKHIGGDFAGFMLSLPLFLWLLAYLFELDFRETFIAAIVITLLRWVSYFGLWRLL